MNEIEDNEPVKPSNKKIIIAVIVGLAVLMGIVYLSAGIGHIKLPSHEDFQRLHGGM